MESLNYKVIFRQSIFKKLLYVTYVLIGAIIFQYNKDAAIIFGCTGIIVTAYVINKEMFHTIIPALFVALFWIILSRDIYSGYNTFKLNIFGLSIFPLLAWPTGLFGFHLLTGDLFTADIWWKKWIKLSLIYSFGVIMFEFIGYNVFHVHLNSGNEYAGWPVLNIFHCAWWMQIAYFVNGILYLFIINTRAHYSWSLRRTFSSVYFYFR